MIPTRFAITLVVTVCLGCVGPLQAIELRVLSESAHDLKVTPIDGGWQFETTGPDPYVMTELDEAMQAQTQVLEFEYTCPLPIKAPSLYFGPPITATNQFDLPTIGQAEGWYKYAADLTRQRGQKLPLSTRILRIDFGSISGMTIRVRKLRLRIRTAKEIESIANEQANTIAKQRLATRITAYINSSPHAYIQDVHVGVDTTTVDAVVTSDKPIPLLFEFPIEQSVGDDSKPFAVDCKATRTGDRIQMTFARHNEGRDRLHSRFAVALSDDVITNEAFNTDQSLAFSRKCFATSFALPEPPISTLPKPSNQKGLSEFSRRGPEGDLTELGISAVTLNLVLNRFITDGEGPNRERIPVLGEPVYFDHEAFGGIDDLTMLARKHRLVISAILLIVNSETAGLKSPLLHPEADGGVYAMPDLTSARGVGVYAFVLDKLAERYRDPTSELGGITNWIAHNEVDFHSVWTNLGKQPRPIATETYYRSMRMIHNAARLYQPGARVFASLTHHWVQSDDGSDRQLSPREVIETLQRLSGLEGDFNWGVAYHPYPESLFAKVAWEDKAPTDSFDTPLITIQNLPVLTRFLEQPSMRDSSGRPRPVILSEQGFHTADISDDAQKAQAESLHYAMKQVRALPLIESFHYHRWLDHPDEGGLNLGLRTQPTPSQPFGIKKQSWEVYRQEK